jgi:enamine deaminase RidA (YjgF/YER057c/UK114 family)
MDLPRFVPASGLYAGAPYEYGAIADGHGVLFTAGACPIDATGTVPEGGPAEQASLAVDNLLVTLTAAGCGPEHLVRTTVYVVGRHAALIAAWEAVSARLAPHRPPSTLLGVMCLGYAGQLVEIDAVAMVAAGIT